MVQETYKQTRARYQLAELARREHDLRNRLEKLRLEESALASPARLGVLARERLPGLVALGEGAPERGVAGEAGEKGRGPGTVLDRSYLEVDRPIRMALADR
jgi:hypothetical protein